MLTDTGASRLSSSDFSLEHQRIVRETLRSILESPHFKKSKRFPPLIEFVVLKTLEGNSNALKERAIGIEVFGRPCDYDAGADPVVRVAAGEVRRRLTQYYSDHPDAAVRIDLPLGGYTAEFHFRAQPVDQISRPAPISTSLTIASPKALEPAITPDLGAPGIASLGARGLWNQRLSYAVGAGLLLLILAALGMWRVQLEREKRDFWWPVLHDGQPPVVLVGKTDFAATGGSGSAQPPTSASSPAGRANFLIINDVVVAARLCGVFRQHGRDCSITQSPAATLDTLHRRSVVSIGANNEWSSIFLAPLRYQFSRKAHEIVEHTPNGDIPMWKIDNHDMSAADFTDDYAIVARFQSKVNDGTVVVIAGLAPEGTDGAEKFLSSGSDMGQILSLAPKDWKGSNFEAVLQIDVIHGSPGQTKVVATRFW